MGCQLNRPSLVITLTLLWTDNLNDSTGTRQRHPFFNVCKVLKSPMLSARVAILICAHTMNARVFFFARASGSAKTLSQGPKADGGVIESQKPRSS